MAWSRRGLSELQIRVLQALKGVEGSWLSGGAALGGFHTEHRRSYDLDLFCEQADAVDELGRRLELWAATRGLGCERRQSYPGFRRYVVEGDGERTLVDLVHEPAEQVVPDNPEIDGLRVEPIRELRANKLAALLGRGETKDLEHLYVLEGAGWPALDGLEDARRKDGSMEASTLAWVLAAMRRSRRADAGGTGSRPGTQGLPRPAGGGATTVRLSGLGVAGRHPIKPSGLR